MAVNGALPNAAATAAARDGLAATDCLAEAQSADVCAAEAESGASVSAAITKRIFMLGAVHEVTSGGS